MNQNETTFVPFKFPMCLFSGLTLHQLREFKRARETSGRRASAFTSPFYPLEPPGGSRGTKSSQQLCRPFCPTLRDVVTVLWFFLCKMMRLRGTRCYCCGWELITSFLGERKKKSLLNFTLPLSEASFEVPLYLDNFSSRLYSFLFLSPPAVSIARTGHISVLKGVIPAWWEAGSIGRPKRV